MKGKFNHSKKIKSFFYKCFSSSQYVFLALFTACLLNFKKDVADCVIV